MPPRIDARALPAALLLGALAVAAAGAAPPADDEPWDLAARHRVVARYDFEEAAERPIDFPRPFVSLGPERGYPGFGRMRVVAAPTTSGRFALAFESDGDSLAASIPTGVLPVFTSADYEVALLLRTVDCDRARVRVGATLHDGQGNAISRSRVETPLLTHEGSWKPIRLHLHGEPDAAHLVLDLELLQPRAFTDPATNGDAPLLDDLDAVAWFDAIEVRQRPRIDLALQGVDDGVPGLHTVPRLVVDVHDLTSEHLSAALLVTDLDGRVVHRGAAPSRGTGPVTIALPSLPAGWYRAELQVRGAVGIAGRRAVDFVIPPPPRRDAISGATRLGVVLEGTGWMREEGPALVRRLEALGAGTIVATVWDESLDPEREQAGKEVLRRLTDAFAPRGVALGFLFAEVPRHIASASGIDPPQILDLLGSDVDRWRSWLDPLLLDFGLRVRRWTIGSPAHPDDGDDPRAAAALARLHGALAPLLPRPDLGPVIAAWTTPPALPPDGGLHVVAPPAVGPEEFEAWSAPWRVAGRRTTLHLRGLARGAAPRDAMIDLALRALAAFRVGCDEILVDTPWIRDDQGGIAPTPSFALWRGLALGLHGRRFAVEVPFGPGIRAWLLEGRGGDDAIVAWSDAGVATAQLALGAGTIRVADAFGNVSEVPRDASGHRVAVGEMPIFLEGIDGDLARFRAGLAILPPRIPAAHRAHEATLRVANPWPHAIAGSIALAAPPGVVLRPESLRFAVGPGSETRVPIEIVVGRGVLTGAHEVLGEVQVAGERDVRLSVALPIEIAWEGAEIAAAWQVVDSGGSGARDLLVRVWTTNRSTSPVVLDAFVQAPGYRRERRSLPPLAPGETTVRSFLLADGAARLAGAALRFGVAERGGTGQALAELLVPAALRPPAEDRALVP